jgi:hypothetical protein
MNHLYEQYENTDLWNALKDALTQLKDNADIEVATDEKYVIGFLCKSLEEKGLTG